MSILARVTLSFSAFVLVSCTTSMQQSQIEKSKDQESSLADKKIEGGKVDAEVLKATPSVENAPAEQQQYREVADNTAGVELFRKASAYQDSGDLRRAESTYRQYQKAFAEGQFADRVGIRLGNIYMERHDYEQARKNFRGVVELSPPSQFRGLAQFGEARAEFALGQTEGALKTLSTVNFREISRAQTGEVFAFWSKVAAQDGRWLESTLASVKAYYTSGQPGIQQAQALFVREQIDRRLVESELQFVLKEYPNRFPSNELRLRLATLQMARGEKEEATQLLMKIMSSAPAGSAVWEKAKNLQARAHQFEKVANYKIGVLLPLSGRQERFGRAVIDGLEIALKGQNIQLVLADTGPNKGTLKAAFERLVFEDRVMGVVGPLSGANSDFVAQWAVEYGVPGISLSSKPGLTDKGAFVFRTALTPQKQVRALVRHSREKLGAEGFAVMFPQDRFGEIYASEYVDAVRMNGGKLAAAESYAPKQTDFKVPIQNMTGRSYEAFREEEKQMMIEEKELALERELNPRELRDIELPPIVDFDVLFIPDTYRALGQIIPALLYGDVRKPVLLGPATWRNPNLLRRAGQYLDGALFVDAWSIERQNPVTQNFVESFQLKIGKAPQALNAIGYDVGLALAAAYTKGSRAPSSREELRLRLSDLGEIEGAVGTHVWDSERDSLAEIQLFKAERARFVYLGSIDLN